MTEEIEATIKVLDRLGRRISTYPIAYPRITWSIVVHVNPTEGYELLVKLRSDIFFIRMDGPFGGFELLEKLGEYPDIAAKLAEAV